MPLVPSQDSRRNVILAVLADRDLAALLEGAAPVAYPSGHTIKLPGQPYSEVFFPTDGVVSAVSVLPAGQNIEVAAVGADGVVGVGAVLGLAHAHLWYVAQIGVTGYRVPVDEFTRAFHVSEPLREAALGHVGRLLAELARSASCNRFHSHRQRLARWLVITMRTAGVLSLPLTHDFIAQMVGGQRHAVTAALADLRARGAIHYRRGLIVIVNEDRLLEAACECASAHAALS